MLKIELGTWDPSIIDINTKPHQKDRSPPKFGKECDDDTIRTVSSLDLHGLNDDIFEFVPEEGYCLQTDGSGTIGSTSTYPWSRRAITANTPPTLTIMEILSTHIMTSAGKYGMMAKELVGPI